MILSIKVRPNSGESRFDAEKNIAYLKSSPEKNKANIELIKLIARHFHVSSSKIRILQGKTSKNKKIEIL
jgi:uncharacterized protein